MQHKLEESRVEIKKALLINPYSPTLHGNLGINYLQDNKLEKAM